MEREGAGEGEQVEGMVIMSKGMEMWGGTKFFWEKSEATRQSQKRKLFDWQLC